MDIILAALCFALGILTYILMGRLFYFMVWILFNLLRRSETISTLTSKLDKLILYKKSKKS